MAGVSTPAFLPSLTLLDTVSGMGNAAGPAYLPHMALFGSTATRSMSIAVGSYAYTGSSVLADYQLSLAKGQFNLTGYATVGGSGRTLAVTTGSYGINGRSVNLVATTKFPLAQGSYSLTGQDVSLRRGSVRTLTILRGNYDLNGQAVTLRVGKSLPIAAGTYTVNGQTVNLVVTEVQHETVPYLIGSTIDSAMQMIDAIHCDAIVTGSGGTVISQFPAAFSLILRHTFIQITMGGPVYNPSSGKKAGLPPYNAQEGL